MMYKVQPDKTIAAPDGTRFIIKGVTAFDYLFVTFEARTDQTIRETYKPSGSSAEGTSKPTYLDAFYWKSETYIRDQIVAMRLAGINTIRVAVEAAMLNADVTYTNGYDGNEYPPDMEQLDTIIQIANHYNMVVLLTCGRDLVATNDNIAFLQALAGLYKHNPQVWINPANEINCSAGGSICQDVDMWAAEQAQYINALRSAGWVNPIVINSTNYGHNVSSVTTKLNASPFSTDPNLIIGVHSYRVDEADFNTSRKATELTKWANYLGNYAILIEEAGIYNYGGERYDPDLDYNVPSVNLTTWGQIRTYQQQFCDWCALLCNDSTLNGYVAPHWKTYFTGLAKHDDNTLTRRDGSWTNWGNIYKRYFMDAIGGQTEAAQIWTTVFTATVNNQSGLDLNRHNLRTKIPAPGNGNGTKVRVTLKGPPSASPVLSGVFIGQQSTSDAQDMVNPARLTFNGNNGVTVPAGQEVVSDAISFNWDGTKNHLLSFASTTAGSYLSYQGLTGGANYYKSNSHGLVGTADVSGYTASIYLNMVSKIEILI